MKRVALAGVVCFGLFAVSCGSSGSQSSPQAQMKSWVTSTAFGPAVGTLENDAKASIKVLASNQGVNAAHTVCAVLMVDAEAANGNLPTPNETASNLLSKSYGDLGAAAAECYVAPTNSAAYAKFNSDITTGLAYLVEGQATVESVIGAPISTSTTADNGSLAQ